MVSLKMTECLYQNWTPELTELLGIWQVKSLPSLDFAKGAVHSFPSRLWNKANETVKPNLRLSAALESLQYSKGWAKVYFNHKEVNDTGQAYLFRLCPAESLNTFTYERFKNPFSLA